MNLFKKSMGILRRPRVYLLIVSLSLLIGVLSFQKPIEVYAATDPGLDSGNATVDRTTVAGQTILKYTTTGNSTFKAPAGVTSVRVLVVGGGGGGGAGESNSAGDAGGGGGAGEYRHETSLTVTPGADTTVTVGGGGGGSQTNEPDGGTTAQNGASGSNSVFGSLTARGGGGGGGNDQGGLTGGSGGGAGGKCSSGNLSGGAKTAVVPGVGNNGGNSAGSGCGPRGASGGGGSGAVGTNSSGGGGATGGTGLQNDIAGTNVFYSAGGGGGGGASSGAGASGGSSIGGNGGNASGGNGTSATVNTGSGGGGGGSVQGTGGGKGGAGSAGIVVVRFTTQTIPDPMGITGVRMWYKADSVGNTNGQWNDSSGLGYHMTQATGSKQPVLTTNAINFNPAYVFDGTDDVFRMASHGIAGTDALTAFFGANATRSDGGWRYFNEFGDDTPDFGLNNGVPTLYARGTSPIELSYGSQQVQTPHVFSFVSPNANNQSRVVGVDDNEQTQNVTSGTYTTNSGGQAGTSFGSTNGSGGTSWAGPIAEAIYFNRVLTPAERLKVVSYLGIKYGVTRFQGTSGMGYVDSNSATIWPADATFKNNIAGIGRDDSSTLNQKQSTSSAAGDIVTIGNGTIAASNQANTNNFATDRSFLLWGHNGAATNTTTTVTGAYNRMNRIWKAVNTNAVGQVKVQIPTSAITGGNGVMYVSSSTTFDAGSQQIAMTVNGGSYEASVTLPAGTRYFSFGSLAGSDIQFVSKTATDIGGTDITSYTPGQAIEYKLRVKNNGPDNSGTVTVTDTLPTGIVPKVSGATGGGWSCSVSSQTVTCTRPVLNSGATAPDITIEANIASNVTGSKLNTATASVSNDPDTSNNSASVTLPAAPKADLSITKAHSGTPVAGQTFTYNFTVTNNGPSDVASFTVSDALDTNLTLDSTSGITCSGTTTLSCTGGALPGSGTTANRTASFSIIVRVSPSYPGGIIANTGTVAVPAGTTDPNTSNNDAIDDTNITVSADLSITKTHGVDFTAGENNDFTITVNNAGASNAQAGSVTVTDTLDEDFSYVPTVNTGWTCTPSGSTVSCTNTAVINAGSDAPVITLRVLVDAIAEGSTTNTADVSSTIPDPIPGNNSATDTITIVSEADLGITKAHVGTGFIAGNPAEKYTFTVVNNGPSADSPSYTITDTLDANFTFAGTTPDSAASCTNAGQVVTCTGGAIGAGDPAQVTTIIVSVNGSASGTIANVASVTPAAGTTDPTPGNNDSTDNVDIEPNADLSISKTHTGTLTAGDNEDYTLTVTNNGPSNVASYTITDTLDSSLTFQSSTPGGACSVTGTTSQGQQEITCNGGALTSGNNASITMTVHVEPTATPGSTISNTAIVAPPATVNDPTPGNNDSTVDNTVDASADLAITKSHTGNFTAGSDTNTFTIEVTNNGPSDASTFTVTDTLPAGLTYVDAQGTAGIGASCTNAGQIITCAGGPTIGVGQTSTITVTVAVPADTAGNTSLDNDVSVASATPDPTTANNNATDSVTIDSSADLGITKSNTSDFTAGNNEDYNLQITNAGPSDVSGFTITDTLPTGLTYVSSSPNICSAIGQNVTCTGGAIEATGSTGVAITVAVGASVTGTVTNTATVAPIAPTTDPNNGNNSSTDPTTVVEMTDLSITKGHTGTFIAGENAAYTMTVNNGGPSNTPTGDVTVSDTLPTGMTYVSAGSGGTGWSCNEVSGTVTCDYAPALAAGGTTPTLTINVSIPADKQGQVANTATVESILDDSNPASDSSTDTTTIEAEADLTAIKAAQGPLTAGAPITYRFEVTNNGGPSVANSVTITDDLENNFTYQGFNTVSGGTWDCAEASGTVTCDLSTPLVVGDTAIVDVTLKVAEGAPNPVDNTAAVTFSGTDPSPANPSDSEPVSYAADLEVKLSHESETYHSGDTVKFTYTVINHGPSAAKNVVLTDTLPEGLTFESIVAATPTTDRSLVAVVADTLLVSSTAGAAPNTPFNCSNSGQNVTCNASVLNVGTYTITMVAKIASSFTGNLTSVLAISSSTPDPNSANNTSSDTILGVLAARGLVGTGQDMLVWLISGAMIILAAVALFIWKARRKASSMST